MDHNRQSGDVQRADHDVIIYYVLFK